MKEIAVVTSNKGKLEEFQTGLGPLGFKVRHMDIDCTEVQADTLEEVVQNCIAQIELAGHQDFILDDSGMFLHHFKGFPGVYSSYVFRTLGCEGVLKLLDRVPDRSAHFESVIGCSIQGTGRIIVKGECQGWIDFEKRGDKGFGFDPIFVPDGGTRTFAEMSVEEKNQLSHRGNAMKLLVKELKWRLEE